MISKLLYIIERGWNRVQANTKLVFLVVILFIFPLLFVLVLEQFYVVAKSNIQSTEQQYIGSFHDSIAAVAQQSLPSAQTALSMVAQNNPDIVAARLYLLLDDDITQIVYSIASFEEAATSSTPTLLKTTFQEEGQTFSTIITSASGRSVQSARLLSLPGQQLVLYTEHSFAAKDKVFNQRKQDAYILLSLIFIFLIGLAYWISRQADWESQYKRLRATLKERDLFSNMIAHEFRTPLTAIKGYASFLQESTSLTDEEHRFADTIGESAERLVLLVNDFLEIARIQSGRMKIEAANIDVRTTITTVTDSLKEEAQTKGLQLIFTPDLKSQMLATDQNRFIQILTNIVSNSVKYTDKGTVEVSCEQDHRGITIRVKDTGMGISAEDQQKLFAPFSRVGGVEKTATTGTGLGMWITKQMIELLNGSIAVESIKDVGTHVVLKFKDVETED